jgi:myo-inositol 2-dehydrogenase / D-chiro-inositol 1-dehydrogenase
MNLINRRQFITTTAVAAAAAALPRISRAAPSRPERLRLGLVGCGGRGYGAVVDALLADPGVELVAMADLFADRLAAADETLPRSLAHRASRLGNGMAEADVAKAIAERATVPPERRFAGWDACERLCALGEVDVVLMAAPPVFRPLHLEAALGAGKHVFMEKPVCVDPVGARKMLELADVADTKKLSVVAGTQRRHQASYREGIQRLHDGQIGEIVAAQCYWLQGGYVGSNLRNTEIPVEEIAYQIRNWFVYIWASGDHIVEQHVHNIDVVLWGLGRTPQLCVAQGGRGVDLPMPAYGNRFSHFAAEFDFGDGVQVASYCRQEPGTFGRVSERFIGTKGVLSFMGRKAQITGETPWEFTGDEMDPYVQEHADLFRSIREGRPLNEIRDVTASCATALLGRESAYTGQAMKYDWLMRRSQQNLTPATWSFGPKAIDPLPVPGKTEQV